MEANPTPNSVFLTLNYNRYHPKAVPYEKAVDKLLAAQVNSLAVGFGHRFHHRF